MRDILLRFCSTLLVFSRFGSAYYIITTTIELPPFSTNTLGPAPYVAKSLAVSAEDGGSKSAQTYSGSSTSTSTLRSAASSTSKVVHLSSSVAPCSVNSTALVKALSTSSCSSKSSILTTNSSSPTPCSKPSTSSQKYIISNSNATAKLTTSAKAVTTNATSSASPSVCTTTTVAFPPFPLSANTTSNLNSLLQMILSVPESIFEKGDADLSSFLKGMGGCLSNGGKGLQTDLTALITPINSFVASFSTSLLTGLENVGQDIENEISHLFGKRDAFADLLSSIENVAVCMSNVANNSTLFDVAKCALDIAELAQPVSRFTKVKNLLGAAGGVAKVLTDLENGTSAETIAKDSLNVLEEALGIADAVKACGFVATKVEAVL